MAFQPKIASYDQKFHHNTKVAALQARAQVFRHRKQHMSNHTDHPTLFSEGNLLKRLTKSITTDQANQIHLGASISKSYTDFTISIAY